MKTMNLILKIEIEKNLFYLFSLICLIRFIVSMQMLVCKFSSCEEFERMFFGDGILVLP
jgi:hypothetical protein